MGRFFIYISAFFCLLQTRLTLLYNSIINKSNKGAIEGKREHIIP